MCFFLICSVPRGCVGVGCEHVGVWVWSDICGMVGAHLLQCTNLTLFIEGCWEVLLLGETGVSLKVFVSCLEHHFQLEEYGGG